MQAFIILFSIGLYMFMGVLTGTLVAKLGNFTVSCDRDMSAALCGLFWPFGLFIIGGLWLGRRIANVVKK